MSEYQVLLLL